MAKALCDGTVDPIWKHIEKDKRKYFGAGFGSIPVEEPIKRMRLTCPKCGRRVLSSVHIIDDGDYLVHTLPPHKPKAWWKKKKNGKDNRKEKENRIRPRRNR